MGGNTILDKKEIILQADIVKIVSGSFTTRSFISEKNYHLRSFRALLCIPVEPIFAFASDPPSPSSPQPTSQPLSPKRRRESFALTIYSKLPLTTCLYSE
jgi:hypothetical protein